MTAYILRRLLLLPLTLFAIILVNFVILNLAPGDPVNMAQMSNTGDATRSSDGGVPRDEQYLLFREHYGLTLPILFNTWPSITKTEVQQALQILDQDKEKLSAHKLHTFRTLWSDRARFIMPHLLAAALDPQAAPSYRRLAANLFIRGGLRPGYVGAKLSSAQLQENRESARVNLFLNTLKVKDSDTLESLNQKTDQLQTWFEKAGGIGAFTKKGTEKISTFFLETRFSRYLKRVLTLDFGTLRSDSNKTVIHEVMKRIKYSLSLAVVPMVITFILCPLFGMCMAVHHNRWIDLSLNVFFLILFAIPVFVVAPFLIEKVALHHTLPFTDIAIPHTGFHSPQAYFQNLTSWQRLGDISLHLLLPLTAVIYGMLAMQTRLSRTAFLEVLSQEHVQTARAKGLPFFSILTRHVGRNGSITILTSLAGSLGVILSGSLIIETIFEINGFGRFFFEACLNRDYNVVLFSAFAGSFLTLIGYLIADVCYTVLDPRVNL